MEKGIGMSGYRQRMDNTRNLKNEILKRIRWARKARSRAKRKGALSDEMDFALNNLCNLRDTVHSCAMSTEEQNDTREYLRRFDSLWCSDEGTLGQIQS